MCINQCSAQYADLSEYKQNVATATMIEIRTADYPLELISDKETIFMMMYGYIQIVRQNMMNFRSYNLKIIA